MDARSAPNQHDGFNFQWDALGAKATLLLAMLVALALHFISRRIIGRSKRPACLTGPSGAGKTALLSVLAGSGFKETVTSQEANEAVLGGKRVVDLPGHPRLREERIGELRRCGKAAIIVDAAGLARGARQAAEALDECLSVMPKRAPILVVANKSDSLSALSAKHARKRLEREVSQLRDNQSFSLDSCGRPISFCSASAADGTVAPILDFLSGRQ